jgi:uncharacterized integral membrane protein
MKNTKIILAAVLTLIVLFLIIQNQTPVEVRLFFFKLEMPLVIMLLINTAIGFLIGLLVALSGKSKPKDNDSENNQAYHK